MASQTNTLKMLPTNLQTPACPSLSHLPRPFPSKFQDSLPLSVFNGRAQCSAKEIPSFPSWLTRKLFGSQLFPGGSHCPQGETERVSAAESTPLAAQFTPIHVEFMWSDHMATGSLCSDGHLHTLCAGDVACFGQTQATARYPSPAKQYF